MFNKVVLVGNLTRDIELRYLQNGTALGKTGIAVSRKISSAGGEKKEETCFIDIDFWGKTAEIANQYLKKGSKVLIEGRLKFDQWQDQNGSTRSKHSIQVDTMEMLSSQQNQGGYGAGSNYNQNQNGYNQSQNSYSQNSYNQGGYQNNYSQNSNYKNQQNAPRKQFDDEYYEEIPEIDVDADKYDDKYSGEDTIPF